VIRFLGKGGNRGGRKVEKKVKSETLRRKLLVQTRRYFGVGTGYATKKRI